jgi:hypothetical protein
MLRPLRSLCLGLLSSLAAWGCDVETRPEDTSCQAFAGEIGDRGIVVASSAYDSSSVVSLLSWDGTVRTTSLWSSARRDPGLTTALSGDIGATWTPDPRGDVSLFDRSTGVLTWISPSTCALTTETRVGDFRSNPYDVVTSESLARTFVVRFDQRADGEEGGDVLVLGADRITPIGRVDLRSFVADEPTARPHPARAVLIGETLYVVLQGFFGPSTGYEHAVDATIVKIDARTLQPLDSIRLSGVKNCGALLATRAVGAAEGAPLDTLLLSCTGVHVAPLAERLAASAIVTVDLSTDQMRPGVVVPAQGTGERAFGPTLARLPSGRVLTSVFGDNSDGKRDAWLTLALAPDAPDLTTVRDGEAFSLGEVQCRGAFCWGADAGGSGQMVRLEEQGGVLAVTQELALDTKLPPRWVGRF